MTAFPLFAGIEATHVKPMKLEIVGVFILAALLAAFAVFAIWMPGRSSALPDFDAAEFVSHGPSGRSVVRLSGADAQRLRPIFDGIPREREPRKWVAFGHLTLFARGKEVLQIDVLSGPGGEGPFGIEGKGSYLGYDESALNALLTDFGWRPDPAR
jgi:hypothetical protein